MLPKYPHMGALGKINIDITAIPKIVQATNKAFKAASFLFFFNNICITNKIPHTGKDAKAIKIIKAKRIEIPRAIKLRSTF
jgi:hypothetical protein